MTERNIAVEDLARVEGEGALKVRIHNKAVEEVELRIFEPPRFFEGFLRGRMFSEAPDITARICGICPVAYQMSSCHAMERALGIRVGGQLRELRRLLYCGEWIESHALHIYLLHAPDFLGYPDALRLAKDHPDVVKQGLELKKVGNDLMTLLGGREIHPINVRVGGFYRVPSIEELEVFRPRLERALALAEATARFTATLKFPEIEEDYEFVRCGTRTSTRSTRGRSSRAAGSRWTRSAGQRCSKRCRCRTPTPTPSSTRGSAPTSSARSLATRSTTTASRPGPRRSPTSSPWAPSSAIRSRASSSGPFEMVFAIEESLRILNAYRSSRGARGPDPSPIRAGAAGRSPRRPGGYVYDGYRSAPGGKIEDARIVAPTTQNLKRMEEDIRHLVEQSIELDDAHLTDACEHSVRNHDPCISCATHFLTLDIQRKLARGLLPPRDRHRHRRAGGRRRRVGRRARAPRARGRPVPGGEPRGCGRAARAVPRERHGAAHRRGPFGPGRRGRCCGSSWGRRRCRPPAPCAHLHARLLRGGGGGARGGVRRAAAAPHPLRRGGRQLRAGIGLSAAGRRGVDEIVLRVGEELAGAGS